MAETTNNLQENEKEEVKADSAELQESSKTNDVATESAVEQSNEEPTPELLNKIRKQVEFYFGDVNMQRDKFVIEQSKLDDGWIPMTIMLNFKMLASLSKDTEVILKALENSDLIEVSEDKKKIRRSPNKPLPTYDEKYRKDQEARTIYLKGFPADSTIETFKSYFETTDSVENIIMRKYKKGKESFFKGSILVLFKTLEDAQAFMNQESVKYQETELIKMCLKDYIASKEKEREERLKKKSENVKVSKNQKNNANNKFPKGCLIHLTNIEKELTKDSIKEKFSEFDYKVAFVDYSNGNTEGYVRFHGENSAAELLKQFESNVLKINECDVTCTLLEGKEEEAYLTKIQENMARFNRRDKGRYGKRGFKRRHSPHRNENSKKQNTGD